MKQKLKQGGGFVAGYDLLFGRFRPHAARLAGPLFLIAILIVAILVALSGNGQRLLGAGGSTGGDKESVSIVMVQSDASAAAASSRNSGIVGMLGVGSSGTAVASETTAGTAVIMQAACLFIVMALSTIVPVLLRADVLQNKLDLADGCLLTLLTLLVLFMAMNIEGGRDLMSVRITRIVMLEDAMIIVFIIFCLQPLVFMLWRVYEWRRGIVQVTVHLIAPAEGRSSLTTKDTTLKAKPLSTRGPRRVSNFALETKGADGARLKMIGGLASLEEDGEGSSGSDNDSSTSSIDNHENAIVSESDSDDDDDSSFDLSIDLNSDDLDDHELYDAAYAGSSQALASPKVRCV